MDRRAAHEAVGKLVRYAIQQKKPLEQLTLAEFQAVSPAFDQTVYQSLSVDACVNGRNITGAPASQCVLQEVERAERFLKEIG
jgi:argininosuccinate lyase